jgi:hypothetical protein
MEIAALEIPSLEQSKRARKMLRAQVPLARVIKYLGGSFDETAINAGIVRLREHARIRAKRDTDHHWKGMVDFHQVKNIPKTVEDDRDFRATLQPRDTTALRMGDPLPGYSMAEKAPSIVPTRRRDPLDALIFKPREMARA